MRGLPGPEAAPLRPAPGQLLSVVTEDGIAVMKVLAVDAHGVHARLYAQRFAQRPKAPDLPELFLVPFGPEYNNPSSIGHMPLSHRSFEAWQPEVITTQAVDEEELDGYRMWEEANGGYF